MFKKHLGVSLLVVIITLVALLLPIVSAVYFSYHNSLHDRRGQAESMVNTAIHIINHQYLHYTRGDKTEGQAQKDAIELIQLLRFGDNDYVWIIREIDVVMLMHPDERLVNTNVNNLSDENGTRVYQAMQDAVFPLGFGYMSYWWPKPDHMDGLSHEKISYIRRSSKWGWIIGAGIYTDDILFTIWQSKFRYFILFNISVTIIIICLYVHSKLIVQLSVRSSSRRFNDEQLSKEVQNDNPTLLPEKLPSPPRMDALL